MRQPNMFLGIKKQTNRQKTQTAPPKLRQNFVLS